VEKTSKQSSALTDNNPMPSPTTAIPLSPSPRGFFLLLSLILLASAAKPILYDTLDPDCFWHLRVGEQLLHEGIHPLHDHLSFASIREPWTPYSWLAEIGMFKLWVIGGYRAAILMTSILIIGTLAFTTMAAREMIESVRPSTDDHAESPRFLETVISIGFASFLSLPYLSFRPVTAAICLLAACVWLVIRDRRLVERSVAVWLVVPLAAFIINLHLFALLIPIWSACLLLGALIEKYRPNDADGLDELRRRARRYGTLLVLTVLACCCTPMLRGLLVTIHHYSLRDPMVASNVISEMQPFWHGSMGKVSLALVLFSLGCLIHGRSRLRPGNLAIWVITLVLLLWMGRFSPIYALAAAPLLAITLPALSDKAIRNPLLQVIIAAVVLCALGRTFAAIPGEGVALGSWLNRNGPDAPGYPVDAAAFIDIHCQARSNRLINEFTWGGYLAWRLGDRFQVLLDGRTQLYSPQFWNSVYFGGISKCKNYLTTTHAEAALLPITKSRFREPLLSLGWKSIYHDDRAEVLIPPTDLATLDNP
jgi:hypothetical protein